MSFCKCIQDPSIELPQISPNELQHLAANLLQQGLEYILLHNNDFKILMTNLFSVGKKIAHDTSINVSLSYDEEPIT